jgi:hypothetical protein
VNHRQPLTPDYHFATRICEICGSTSDLGPLDVEDTNRLPISLFVSCSQKKIYLSQVSDLKTYLGNRAEMLKGSLAEAEKALEEARATAEQNPTFSFADVISEHEDRVVRRIIVACIMLPTIAVMSVECLIILSLPDCV